jgi:quercetin dioxygenase-like cupin family protein
MGSDGPRLERTRQAPAERFAGAEHLFDLAAEAARLRAEPRPGKDGHRQIVLFRQEPVSLVLFDLEPGGSLADHEAEGLVTIHVLSGRVEVRTPETRHEVTAGSVLVLRPGIKHDLVAAVAAEVLVTIHLGG